jgi:type IV secretion system protein VirB6
MGSDIFGAMFSQVDTLGTTAVQSIYTSLATSLQPVFTIGMAIYVAFWGYEMLFGRAPLTAGEFVWRIGRMMIIYWLAFTWGDFSALIVSVLTTMPNDMGTVVCTAVGGQSCNAAGNSVSAGLTNVWTAANTVSGTVSSAGGITGIGLAILSYVILIIAILFIAFAAFLIVFGKIALFVLLSLAPLFICMALFQITSHLFNGWMRSCAQYALIPVIVYAFLGFFLVLIQTTITNIQATTVNSTTALTVISPFLLMCLIGFFLLSQILNIVHGIASGGAMLRASGAYSLAAAGGAGAAAGALLLGGAAFGGGRSLTGRAISAFRGSSGPGSLSGGPPSPSGGQPASAAQVEAALKAARN